MPQDSWEESWQAGRTPWDAGGPAAQLVALLEADRQALDRPAEAETGLAVGPSAVALGPSAEASSELAASAPTAPIPTGRALVPGCGSGYDVLALAGAGRQALGLDLAPTAILRFRALRDAAGMDAEAAEAVAADYFEFQPEQPFDLIWDYTFLCAIPPALREAWARRAHALLRPGGELITLIFPVLAPPGELPAGSIEGPPFALDPYAVRSLLTPWFEQIALGPAEHSHPARAGREWLGRWRRRETGRQHEPLPEIISDRGRKMPHLSNAEIQALLDAEDVEQSLGRGFK